MPGTIIIDINRRTISKRRLLLNRLTPTWGARALIKLLIEEDQIDEATLSEIANSPHKRIREYVVNNPSTPQQVLERYLKDPVMAMPAFRNLESRKLITDEMFRRVYSAYGAKSEWQRIIAASGSCPRKILIYYLFP